MTALLHECTEEQVAEREQVRRAALYMDSVKPDWWAHIDPVKLNLGRSDDCICGQNGLNWETHLFAVDEILGDDNFVFITRVLEPFWLEEIAQRMPAPVREQVPA